MLSHFCPSKIRVKKNTYRSKERRCSAGKIHFRCPAGPCLPSAHNRLADAKPRRYRCRRSHGTAPPTYSLDPPSSPISPHAATLAPSAHCSHWSSAHHRSHRAPPPRRGSLPSAHRRCRSIPSARRRRRSSVHEPAPRETGKIRFRPDLNEWIWRVRCG